MASPTPSAPPAPPTAAAHNATTVVDSHEGHPAGFPPFERETFGPQLIWLALTFGFLYYMLSKRLLPRVSQAIENRASAIRADLAAAAHLKTETEQSLKAYEQALGAAKSDATGIAKAQGNALAAEQERERSAADAETAAKIASAERQIAASKATALSAVGDVARDTVSAIVAKLTGQNVTGEEIARAIAAVRTK